MIDDSLKLINEQKYDEALKVLKKNLKQKTYSDLAQTNANIAFCYLRINKYGQSLKFYLSAEDLDKNNIDILNGIATVYFLLGNYKEAISYYHKIFRINKKHLQSLANLANLYFTKKKFYLSKKYYLKIYEIDPKNLTSYRGVFRNNYKLNLFSDTLIWLKRGKRHFLDKNLQLSFLYLNCAPNVHFSKYLKSRLINRFICILNKLDNNKENFYFKDNREVIDALCSTTNFHIAYCDDLDLKYAKKYSNLIKFFTNKFFDKKNIIYQSAQNFEKKIKIAFISDFFYNHTVLRLYSKFLTNLSELFDVHVIHMNPLADKYTKILIENKNINFHHKPNIYELLKEFYNGNFKFDIIIYPEIGMDPETVLLSSLRLADIQCVGWGHPVTSGNQEIDYFISSESMELDNSEKNYSEKLIKLPSFGLELSQKIFVKKDFKIKDKFKRNKVICLQSFYKILSEDMNAYFNLIERKEDINLFIISDKNDFTNKKFKTILKSNFDIFFKKKRKFEEFFFFIKPMNRNDFVQNIQNYDVVIDTFNWSGGNTHLEALLMGLPVVTCPSHTMKSRHTYAFLKEINVNELIAENKDQYIDLILKLLNDDIFYHETVDKINKNNHKLYKNNIIESFQNFLEEKVNKLSPSNLTKR